MVCIDKYQRINKLKPKKIGSNPINKWVYVLMKSGEVLMAKQHEKHCAAFEKIFGGVLELSEIACWLGLVSEKEFNEALYLHERIRSQTRN